MVLIKNPNFLILDEPTNDLDIVTLNTLEEFLDNFPGCLIIVSHDRYFMDRLVEHLFVFEGEGKIKDFPGNYTDFREWEKEQKSIFKETAPIKESAKVQEATAIVKNKASFKDKKEFQEINQQIEKLNEEKHSLISKITNGTEDHQSLLGWSNRVQEIDGNLEDLEMRWLELSEFERIE